MATITDNHFAIIVVRETDLVIENCACKLVCEYRARTLSILSSMMKPIAMIRKVGEGEVDIGGRGQA